MSKQNENNESNIYNEIKRYPFHGYSKYLIDRFYTIGYNIPTLHKILFNEKNDRLSENIIIDKNQNDEGGNKSSLNLQQFHLKEEPIVLNEIISDINKDISVDFVMKMILPNTISLYYSEKDISVYNKENSKEKKEKENEDEFSAYEEDMSFDNDLLKTKSFVFSSNPQGENNTKKSLNGLGYIFYRKLKKKQILPKKVITFYIPIIFSIISEFPYFNSFYKLCHQIELLFSFPPKYVPLEIYLYYIIKSSQSPIKEDIILYIKPSDLLINKKNNEINKNKNKNIIQEVINEEDEISVKKKVSDDFNTFRSFKSKDLEDSQRQKIKRPEMINLNSTTVKISKKQEKKAPKTYRQNLDLIQDIFDKKNSRKTISISNNIISNPLLNKGNKKKSKKNTNNPIYQVDELFPKIEFEYLKGYPLIQYNLAKVLLNTLSPYDVIEVFFYTFLERDIIIFSKNLTYLSLTVNSYFNLNYPLNDEKYYFNNATVSFDNFMNDNSPFIGSGLINIKAINDQYQEKYIKSLIKLKDHLVVDLDKGELYKIDDKKDKQKSKDNKQFFKLIKKLCNKNEQKTETILSKEIPILYKTLSDINALLKGEGENETKKNEQYKLFKDGELLDYDNSKDNYIKKTNLKIQNAFYRFTNTLCLYFYQNLGIKVQDDDVKIKKNILTKNNKENMFVEFRYDDEKEKIYSKEELYFLEELRGTLKYQSFVNQFVQSYSPIDLYKIPLTFTEEFLSIISRKSSLLDKSIDFFEIIDTFYDTKYHGEFDIDFTPFFINYNKEYKDYFFRELNDENEENKLNEDLIKVKYVFDENEKTYYLKYRDYELDNNLLMKYMNLINSLDKDKYNNLFYCSDFLRSNIPRNIFVINIENLIENYSIETELLSKNDICCSNIILLFSLSLNFFDPKIDFQSSLGIIFNKFIVFRKYYSYIMNIIYLLFNNCIKQENYSRANFYLLCYYICINSIRVLKLVPNESLMNIIKKFYDLDLKKFDDNVKNQKINENEINNNDANKRYIPENLTKKNLIVTYNFTYRRVVSEHEIIEKANKEINNDISINIDNEIIQPKIKYVNKISKVDSYFYSQTAIITQLVNVYNKFLVDLDEKKIAYKLLIDCCLNILIFMRNCDIFEDKEEIKDIVENIFFLFLNKLDEINIAFSNLNNEDFN